jgi:hypothetical protein
MTVVGGMKDGPPANRSFFLITTHPTIRGFSLFLGYLADLFEKFRFAQEYMKVIDRHRPHPAWNWQPEMYEYYEIEKLREPVVAESMLAKRLEAGLVSAIQLDLLSLAAVLVVEEIKEVMLSFFERENARRRRWLFDKHEGFFLTTMSTVDQICLDREPLIRFLAELRSESIEARIWKYVNEKDSES